MLRNPWLVHNTCHSGGIYITINCNTRKIRVTKEYTPKGYGVVWFDEGDIANILSFIRIWDKYSIRYDTKRNYFSIVKPDKEVLFI